MFEKINELTQKIKQTKPLILNITNDVTMDFIANGLLSVGASPVMSQSEQEVEDLVKIASAVVINLGTLDARFIKLCEQACKAANQFQKPIILDPVGAGATHYRTSACTKLINDYQIAIIRGNASEIMSLSGISAATKGVDSSANTESAINIAKEISVHRKAAVVVSGRTDVIIDGHQVNAYERGSAMMPMITGTGCLLSAVVGAFHAVEQNRFIAAQAATLFYSVCGEIAAEKAEGPGSFRMQFLDALHAAPVKSDYHE